MKTKDRPTLWERAFTAAKRQYAPGFTRAAYLYGYVAGWRAAKREKRR